MNKMRLTTKEKHTWTLSVKTSSPRKRWRYWTAVNVVFTNLLQA